MSRFVIDTQIASREIDVEIDGIIYPVNDFTLEVAEKSKAIIDKFKLGSMKKLDYHYAMVDLMVGKEARVKIFPMGEKESIARLEHVTEGLANACMSNKKELEELRESEKMEEAEAKLEKMSAAINVIKTVNGNDFGASMPDRRAFAKMAK